MTYFFLPLLPLFPLPLLPPVSERLHGASGIILATTSALDTTTEQNLHLALQAFLHGRTTLIIAHRLSAVRQADRALVFDGGQIVEDGSHDDLIRSDGLYASLYRRAET